MHLIGLNDAFKRVNRGVAVIGLGNIHRQRQWEIQAQQGRLQFWVRNLARREGASYFLQKATGRFYPDFICKRNDNTFLIVEYKGGNGWTDAADDRLIGGLWANMSGGTCRFVMLKDRQWEAMEPFLT